MAVDERLETELAQPVGQALTVGHGLDAVLREPSVIGGLAMPITFAPALLASWTAIQLRVRDYMIAFLVLEALMVGTFCALDLVLFYLFFEAGF